MLEDKISELELRIGITQDDVAMLIEVHDDYEELTKELKEYFELDEDYYKNSVVKDITEQFKSLTK